MLIQCIQSEALLHHAQLLPKELQKRMSLCPLGICSLIRKRTLNTVVLQRDNALSLHIRDCGETHA